ncbi:MAG: arabinose-5-phosphate isomerase [Paraglaciecola sp.]
MNSEKIIQETARRTIEIEKNTVKSLFDSINTDFENAVKSIFQSLGRVVVTGIGKSAIVGQKIVATLNSTGTPAIFMHAADAIHGDLGMIQSNDIVLCISKSGETSEVKVLVPLLKNMGNLLIGMVSNKTSYLGQRSDYVLHTPISVEADPNNLAPTASTTAQMVLGDAVATSLLALRGFTPKDFAQFHPGGLLGKQLYLRASDLFIQNESPSVPENATIHQTILEMTSKRLGCAVVLNAQKNVLGIITDGDLRRMLEKLSTQDFSSLEAKDIMSKNPKTIDKDCLAVKALEVMREGSITQLIVVEDGRYLGIIHLHDLIREGLV